MTYGKSSKLQLSTTHGLKMGEFPPRQRIYMKKKKKKNDFSITWVDIAIGVLIVAIMAMLALSIVP